MSDKIEKLKNSLIQHGKENDRIYLLKLSPEDKTTMPRKLIKLGKQNGYSKLFVKVPMWAYFNFNQENYIKEAFIPNFYNGDTAVYFMAMFLDKEREKTSPKHINEVSENLKIALSKNKPQNLDPSIEPIVLNKTHVEKLTRLYKNVFPSYPFPIFEKDYIFKTMDENVQYYGIFSDDELVAASSAEMDIEAQNVEMTDFATHPDFRGKNASYILLQKMEKEVKAKGIKTAYTIARSLSPGMNITFSQSDYKFGGTLRNNTFIFGAIESMNVWYKSI